MKQRYEVGKYVGKTADDRLVQQRVAINLQLVRNSVKGSKAKHNTVRHACVCVLFISTVQSFVQLSEVTTVPNLVFHY